ncbi:MAG: hypothetical protein GY898_28385 [Proteobacteria bacterium]|nr:hypothetical protein [Pseudomonadota bacterium]
MRPLLLVLALSVTVGCAGSVTVDSDDVDAFGPGTSAAYVKVDLAGDTFHFFVLANQGGICSKLQTAYAGAYSATSAFNDGADDDACNDYTAALADVWDPVLSGSAHLLSVTVNNGFDFSADEITEPSDGTFDAGEGEVGLRVSYFPSGDSPYLEVAERAEGCAWDDAIDDGLDSITSYGADDGDVVLEEANNDGWRIDFEVEIEDEDGDNAGDLSGGFGAPLCDIELDEVGPLEFTLNPYAYSPWLL